MEFEGNKGPFEKPLKENFKKGGDTAAIGHRKRLPNRQAGQRLQRKAPTGILQKRAWVKRRPKEAPWSLSPLAKDGGACSEEANGAQIKTTKRLKA